MATRDSVTSPQDPLLPSEGVPSLLGGKRKLLLGLLVIGIALMYLAVVAFQNATTYYLTVDELVVRGYTEGSERVQVKGKLVPDSFFRVESSLVARFQLGEGGEQIAATYEGVLPDLFFNPHSEVVLSGRYEPSGVFITDRVLVKCPSKYQSLEYQEPPPQVS